MTIHLVSDRLRKIRKSEPVNGNRIAAALEIAGATQAELAEATGFTQSYISDVVRGRYQTITLENARRLASALGLSVDEAFPSTERVA